MATAPTPSQRTIVLCGDNKFFRGPFSKLIKQAGWKRKVAPMTAAAQVAGKDYTSKTGILVLDLSHKGVDPVAVLTSLPSGPDRPHVVAYRGGNEDPGELASLKSKGVVWFFDETAPPNEITFAIQSIFEPQQVATAADVRAPSSAEVEFWQEGEEPRPGKITDVSENGVFVETDDKQLLGTVLNLRFQLQGINGVIHAIGDVVFVTPRQKRKSGFTPGIGIKFKEITDDDQARVKSYVTEILKRMPDLYHRSLLGVRNTSQSD